MTHRPERVAELLQQVLAELIRDEVRDPRIGFVTVTEVRVSPDLKHARVFVSCLGELSDREASVKALNRASAFLRRALGRETRLKYVPDLEFDEDRTLETSLRVERLLDEIDRDEPRGFEGEDGDDGER